MTHILRIKLTGIGSGSNGRKMYAPDAGITGSVRLPL